MQKAETLTQYCVTIPNKTGMLAKLTEMLAKQDCNIECMMAENLGDVACCRFIVQKDEGLKQKLEKAGFTCVETTVCCVRLPNKPGEFNKLCQKLADEEIDIACCYCTSQGTHTTMVLGCDQIDKAMQCIKEVSPGAAVMAGMRN